MEQDILLPFNSVAGSILFEDLDNDGLAEIIFGDEGSDMHILKTEDSNYSSFYYYNNMGHILSKKTYANGSLTSEVKYDFNGQEIKE